MTKNIYLLVCNTILFFVNLQVTLRGYHLSHDAMRSSMEAVAHGTSAAIILFGYLFTYCHYDTALFGFSVLVTIVNTCVMLPPVLLVARVLRERDSSYISAPFAVMGAASCAFWGVYGLVIHSLPLYASNGVGLGLSVLQLLVVCCVPSSATAAATTTAAATATAAALADNRLSVSSGGDLGTHGSSVDRSSFGPHHRHWLFSVNELALHLTNPPPPSAAALTVDRPPRATSSSGSACACAAV